MKPSRLKFGVRENTASSRQHASRRTVSSSQPQPQKMPADAHENGQPSLNTATVGTFNLPLIEPVNGATGGESRDEGHLLTVHEVAALLQVPVSWVYEHTRRTCTDPIPGFRLGKYWRFRTEDLAEWLHARRTKHYHHA